MDYTPLVRNYIIIRPTYPVIFQTNFHSFPNQMFGNLLAVRRVVCGKGILKIYRSPK